MAGKLLDDTGLATLWSLIKTEDDKKAETKTYNVSVAGTGWTVNSTGGYYRTETVGADMFGDNIQSTDNPVADVVLGSDAAANEIYLKDWAKVTRITAAAGSITLYASDALISNIMIQLKVVR